MAEPAAAIKILRDVVRHPEILIDPAHFAEDLANLRLAYKDDVIFSSAVEAIALAITMAYTRRERFGTKLTHQLSSYYRAKFQSQKKRGLPADLRLVFRPIPNSSEIEIAAFGNRFDPDSLYRSAQFRATRFQINSVAGSAVSNLKFGKAKRQRSKPEHIKS